MNEQIVMSDSPEAAPVLHNDQGSMDAAADAYEAEYNAASGIT